MLAIPPFGASSNIALWRANVKPPVELVVDDCREYTQGLVSVIIPIYKRADKLLRAIDCICNQTYKKSKVCL